MKNNRATRGISLKKLNYIMSGITLLISVILLISTYITAKKYVRVQGNTENYIDWQQTAQQLQEGSDYLTEQVREYAATGKRIYIENYFRESTETKQRDNALEKLSDQMAGTESYSHLEKSMEYSVELMEREYYSMRMKAESMGEDISTLPKEIQDVVLKASDAALSSEEMGNAAELMVFDDVYHDYKDKIKQEVNLCIYGLAEYTEGNVSEEFEGLTKLLVTQQVLIIGLVVIIIIVILLTSLQVIRPLIKAIPHIKNEKPLPVSGAYEYKYLAKTYNRMYEANKKQKKMLNYDATHDALTGAFNRMGYERIMSSIELTGLAALMIDIDNFKKINDTNGHEAGDRALIAVIKEVRKNFRANDIICRIGGDEFVLFMSGVENNDDTKNLITQKVNGINSTLAKLEEFETVSISVGGAFREEETDAEILVKKADTALYNVKEHGKRGCKFYDDIIDVAD